MKRIFVFLIGFIVAIVFMGIVGYILLKDEATISMGDTSEINTKAKFVDYESIRIVEISPEEFEKLKKDIHKKTLINFWATWCKPCVEEIPVLLEYSIQNDINLIFISADKNNEKQKELMKKQMVKLNLTNTYIIKDGKVTDITGRNSYYDFLDEIKVDYNKEETGIPFFILIDENGNFEKVFNGPNKLNLYSEYYNNNIKN